MEDDQGGAFLGGVATLIVAFGAAYLLGFEFKSYLAMVSPQALGILLIVAGVNWWLGLNRAWPVILPGAQLILIPGIQKHFVIVPQLFDDKLPFFADSPFQYGVFLILSGAVAFYIWRQSRYY
ncbi:hypothetical protein [Herbaspirillum camelliae]|uniref:hypothetical protein n=1 Tax=Herbaspirillum camelliae TaxID=1892903 RepID=UPI00094A17C4|nr:hypothetical protein [Herbaspirillum camelliae]